MSKDLTLFISKEDIMPSLKKSLEDEFKKGMLNQFGIKAIVKDIEWLENGVKIVYKDSAKK
jgi:hypothetical protein